MVWGMALPKNFGKFWPDGDFGSWSGDLVRYYMAQPPEMQLALYDGNPDPVERAVSYPHYVNGKFTNETGSRMSPRPEDPPFSPIKEHEAPQVFITGKTYDELGSLVMFNDGIVAVDDRLRKIIENFEPGSHQFFPIEISTPKGEVFQKLYTFVVGEYFDSFVPEKSDPDAFRELPDSDGKLSILGVPLSHAGPKKIIPSLALSGDVFGRSHLWRERRFGESITCFSDEIASAIKEAGLSIPPIHQMKVV